MRQPFARTLSLPPPFQLVTLREVGDAFAHAHRVAAEMGAGTVVHVGRFDLAEFAVVLEPEEPLETARRSFYAGMCALGDALLAHAPPERSITFNWPGAVLVDGRLVGGGRLAWPSGVDEHAAPDWLVFGATIRTVAMADEEAGLRPLASALSEEGFDDVGSGKLVESFARHLMAALDAWQAGDFTAIAKPYLRRLVAETGVHNTIATNGDLLMRRNGKSEPARHSLAMALEQSFGLDPTVGVHRP